MRTAMIFLTPRMTSYILDLIITEEAILTIGESLYGKYKILDMVWKTVRICKTTILMKCFNNIDFCCLVFKDH